MEIAGLLDILCNLTGDRPNHHLKMKTIWLKLMDGNKDDIKLMMLNFLVGLSLTFLTVSNASAICKVNSQIDYHTDTAGKRLVVEYYPNGKVRLKGYHGHYANKEISTDYYLGTWYYYNQNGTLQHSIYYHNDLPSKSFILKKEYYPNRKVKSIQKYNNYDLYQSEEKKLGKWQYFDKNGKLMKEVQH